MRSKQRQSDLRTRCWLALVAAWVAFCQAPASARGIHYGAVSNGELLACDRLDWRGQADEAISCYRQLLSGARPAAIRAEAAWALNERQAANGLFRDAVATHPDDAAIRVRWGDLYADSHQDSEAMDLYREALKIDAGNAFAMLGAASVLVGAFDDAANTYLEPLLRDATKPGGARAAAWLLVAQVSLENSRMQQAGEALDAAEDILDAGEWPPLELYALEAARDLLQNVTDSPYTAMSLELNPGFGGIYAIPAHFYVITRRYREAIALLRKAVETEPGLAAAYEALGINLLRDNRVSDAREALELAYDLDPFSPQTVNTLRLLDTFDDFRLVRDPETPQPGVLPLSLRLHRDEAAVIAPYAVRLARDSIAEFTARYAFTLKEPVMVEMYPNHDDFAVRTAGMPGIGILGATFGYVVAMDSPSARPSSEFQWGTTLWHEMAHVFTLEATGHLVPRWFSEGVSVFEEWRSGPNPGVHIPLPVYQAIRDQRLLPVTGLDEGFVRPAYPQQVIVSYMQAGLICRFIEQAFGAAKLQDLLYAFGDGLQTDAAITTVFDLSPATFDERFEASVRREYAPILDNLDEWLATQQSIIALISAEDWPKIVTAAERLIGLLPQYVEPDSPYIALARAEDELGQQDRAIAALLEFRDNGGYDPATLKQLAAWLVDAGKPDSAIEVLQGGNLVDPLDRELHGMLGDLLMDGGRAAEALTEFRVALALHPHDKATAYYRLARAHHALGERKASEQRLLQALDIAPNYRPAQRLLLELERGERH